MSWLTSTTTLECPGAKVHVGWLVGIYYYSLSRCNRSSSRVGWSRKAELSGDADLRALP